MKRLIFPLIILLAAAGIWMAISLRANEDDTKLTISGNIEVTDTLVSFRIPGRMIERKVSEGDRVSIGQTVALLDRTELEQEIAIRKAEVKAARAALAELENGYRIEDIRVAEQRVEAAKADRKLAVKNLERAKQLLKRDVISQQEFDRLETADRVTGARLKEAGEQWTQLQKGPRVEHRNQAKARLEQAEAAVELIRTRFSYCTLVSPMTGVVLSDSTEPGEYVNPGAPVVTVGRLDQVWLRAYIAETDLGRVKLGQSVQIRTDAFPDRNFKGRITFISSEAEFTPRMVQTHRERVKLVYRIKVAVDNPDEILKPGMPADGWIEL